MKKIFLLAALYISFGAFAHGAGGTHESSGSEGKGPVEYERESTFQLGLDGGYDFGSKQSSTAVSAALPLGESGFKVVLEYSAGRHGDKGSNVSIIKGVKELYSFSKCEFGAVLGFGRSSEIDAASGETVTGNGWIAGGEAAYEISKLYSWKVEATRFTGIGVLSGEAANVVQTGIIVKF